MICIPMAGKSSRFYQHGFTKPKFQLSVSNFSLFRLSTMSFIEYFETEYFLFVLNGFDGVKEFVEKEIKKLRIVNYSIVELDHETRGQADTVAKAVSQNSININEHLLIFNIDTIRPQFKYPKHFPNFPWIETFKSIGDHWSFIDPIPDTDEVLRVAEKERISDLCSTGIYFFPSIKVYMELFSFYESDVINEELYIAPMYQLLIKRGETVKFSVIESSKIFLAGIPEEFHSLDADKLLRSLKIL
jgi:hypothetical protein